MHSSVIGDASAGKLADQPAVGHLIVEHDRVAVAVALADAAEAGPERDDAIGPSSEAPVVLLKTW